MARTTIPFEDGNGEVHALPATYQVCPDCRGEGASSLYLGAITQEDRERDWSPDEWDAYLRGEYDRTCDRCKGRRVVLVVDMASLKASNAELALEVARQARAEAETRAMERLERMSGA
jgi:hypothetical protein